METSSDWNGAGPAPVETAFGEEAARAAAGDGADAAPDLGRQVKGAVLWRSGSQIAAQVLSWGSTLFVVRILDPSDYGLFAMTQVVLAFLTFLNGYGFASALIRAESIDPYRLRQTFGLLLLLNGGLAAAQLVIAPLAAAHYHQPAIATLLRWQSLLYLSTPFVAIPEVLLIRRLQYRPLALVTVAATGLGAATAISMALAGAGVWTLVVAPIVIFWARAIGLVLATRCFLIPSFDLRGTGAMVAFGGALLVNQGFWVVQSQADVFIAGRALDPHSLGLYAEALFLTQIFSSRFVPPLNEVAFPAYARLQKDPERLAASFLTAVRLIMAIALPLYLGLAVCAAPAVETLFGPKWLAMAPLVSILALAMPAMTLQILFAPALNAVGKPQVTARISACGAVLMPATFLIAVRFGSTGMAWGWTIAFPLLCAATWLQARRHIRVTLAGLVDAITPSLVAAIGMVSMVWALRALLPPLPAPALLAVLGASGVATYALLLRLGAPALVEEVLGLVIRRRAQPA
ncbi:MAG TPA: lipopolysaccharide biosynthesis protein [Allosphingosinicella sp.]|nr:lipopolysaccharide biosynthesis protein [Allosphingosinicella sp.]